MATFDKIECGYRRYLFTHMHIMWALMLEKWNEIKRFKEFLILK